jgi:hypothetical protein
MLYRSKKALLEYILHDGLIRKAFAKECPKSMFVLDEVTNQVIKDSARRGWFRLVAFFQGRPRYQEQRATAVSV